MLFPPVGWWVAALRAAPGPVYLSNNASPHATFLNRYRIATANGPQQLSVPLSGGRSQHNVPLAQLRINYMHDWQRQHWGALYSAYGRAPYFEHYGDDLRAIIYSGAERLEDFCRAGIDWLAKELCLPLTFREGVCVEPDIDWQSVAGEALMPYHQVFEARWGFQPGLSAIDLLMNEGPYAAAVLKG